MCVVAECLSHVAFGVESGGKNEKRLQPDSPTGAGERTHGKQLYWRNFAQRSSRNLRLSWTSLGLLRSFLIGGASCRQCCARGSRAGKTTSHDLQRWFTGSLPTAAKYYH